MIFGSLVCLSGIILTAIDPEPGHKPSAIGAPTDHSGQVAIGGVLLVVGVALFIVGGVLFRQLKKLKDSFPQLPVTFRQTTTRTVSSLVNPLYVEETQATIHPITTVDQTSKANFQQPVYAPTATTQLSLLECTRIIRLLIIQKPPNRCLRLIPQKCSKVKVLLHLLLRRRTKSVLRSFKMSEHCTPLNHLQISFSFACDHLQATL